jgi:hypothetical protein
VRKNNNRQRGKGKEGKTAPKVTIKAPLPPASLAEAMRTPWWEAIWSRITSISIVIGIVASIPVFLGGPPWPVDPDVHFKDTNDGSSLIMPFEITNKSGFDMPSVEFRCGVHFVRAFDALGHQVFSGDTAFLNGTRTIHTSATMDCNAADLLTIGPDGRPLLRNSSTILQTSSGIVYRAPWRVVKMCVWVEGHYRFLGIFPVEFTSHVFQWPSKPGGHQWRESPFIGDRPIEEVEEERRMGLIPGRMACPDAKEFPYIYVAGRGRASLLGGPDPMGGLGERPLPPTL